MADDIDIIKKRLSPPERVQWARMVTMLRPEDQIVVERLFALALSPVIDHIERVDERLRIMERRP